MFNGILFILLAVFFLPSNLSFYLTNTSLVSPTTSVSKSLPLFSSSSSSLISSSPSSLASSIHSSSSPKSISHVLPLSSPKVLSSSVLSTTTASISLTPNTLTSPLVKMHLIDAVNSKNSSGYGINFITKALRHEPNASKVNCGDPGYGENTDRFPMFPSFEFNATITYTCKQNYRMQSNSSIVIRCTKDGRWDGHPPKCEPIECPQILTNRHLKVAYLAGHGLIGTQVGFSCELGYTLKGANKTYCSVDGKWSSSIPDCERNWCERPRFSEDSHISIRSKLKERYEINDRVVASCHQKQRTIVCTNEGKWSSFYCDPPARTTCPSIGQLKNGIYNGSIDQEYKIRTQLIFKCNKGYLLKGAYRLVCLSGGKWTANKPLCVSMKKSPSTIVNWLVTIGSLLLLILFSGLLLLLFRLRQRRKKRQYWKRYFGSYTNRQSKTNIAAPCQEMKYFRQSKSSIPVTDL